MVFGSRCEIFRGPRQLVGALWQQMKADGPCDGYITKSPADADVSEALDELIAAGGAEWGGRFGGASREMEMPWSPGFTDSDAIWEEVERCILSPAGSAALHSSERSHKDETEGFEWVYVPCPEKFVRKLRSGPPLRDSAYFKPGGMVDHNGTREKCEEEINEYLADPARGNEAKAMLTMFEEAASAGHTILICHEVM